MFIIDDKTSAQGFLFSNEELEACDTTPRPVMNLKYFENPKNDNERLFNLQKKYIETKDEATFWEMWKVCATVAERIIKKILRKRRLEFQSDEISDKVSDTCIYLLRRFKTRKYYYIKINWIEAIKDSVRHALDYQNKIDKLTVYAGDYNDIFNVYENDETEAENDPIFN